MTTTLLLSYFWSFRVSAVGATVTAMSNPSSDQLKSSILYFPWPSCIVVFTVFLVAVAHFILQTVYVTRLGLPPPAVVPAVDIELGNNQTRNTANAAPLRNITVACDFQVVAS